MKLRKKMEMATTATLLLTSISGSAVVNDKVANPFNSVIHSASSLKQLSQDEDNEKSVFNALAELTDSIIYLNQYLHQKHFKLNKNKYSELGHIRELLDFASKLMISKFEKVIFSTYSDVYRTYSNAVTQLDTNIYKINQKAKQINVVKIDDLQFSEQEFKEMTDAVNRLYGI